jgi:cell division protein ZapA (FtsZ GTPase activity inhibitor)
VAISDFDLDVLGTSFTITVDEDPEYLNKILTQYRDAVENTKELFNLKEPLTAAILTGFMVSEELHKLKKQAESLQVASENQAREAEERANNMIARINGVLEDSSPDET